MQIDGKQILDLSVDFGKLTSTFYANIVLADGTHPMTASLDLGNNTIINVATPVNATDATNKSYVDSVAAGIDVRGSCNALATADIAGTYNAVGGTGGTGSFTGATITTIDGVTITANMRLLLNGQTDGKQNGIYKVLNVGSGTLERALDADSNPEVTAGMFTFVTQGTVYADTGWVLATADPITLNTTSLLFTQFSSAVTYTFGSGLLVTGSVVTVKPGDGISLTTPTNTAVNVKVSDLVGFGIESDGSNNFRISTAAAGSGLTGGGGVALSVLAFDNTITVAAGGISVHIANTSLKALAGGLEASTPTSSDKQLNPTTTANNTNFQTTGLSITNTPANGSYVQIFVNGQMQWLAKTSGERATADCYFSGDGGTTARAIAAIVAGDTLYWNGANTNAKFRLVHSSDQLDFCYNFAA